MRLKLSLTATPDEGSGQSPEHIFDDRGGVIGRGEDCSWRLPCPAKLVSRRHCVVTFEDGAFHVYDASANGLFVNDASDPLGQGNRHTIASGDRLRLGDYTLTAELIDTSPSMPEHPPEPQASTAPSAMPSGSVAVNPEPSPGTVAASLPNLDESQAASASIRPAALGHPSEAFTPPAAHIPEDWNLELDGLSERPEAQGSVVELLDALEPATTRALLDGLDLPRRDGEELLIEAPTARVIGELLRVAVETVFQLQTEYAAVGKRLSGREPDTAAGVAGHDDPRAFLRALLAERDAASRTRMADELVTAMHELPGRHQGMADVLSESLASVVEQFSPYKAEQRARRRISEPTGAGGALRRAGRRLRFWLARGGACWRSYERWFEAQGGDTYRALNRLFEKKTAALYARRLKPVADRPALVRDAPQRQDTEWRRAAGGGGQG